jgi:hypothetical protein
MNLQPNNWRRILLGGLILASKVWEDEAVWIVDFLDLFNTVTLTDLNILERHWLELLQYQVGLKASQYTKYYCDLLGNKFVNLTYQKID